MLYLLHTYEYEYIHILIYIHALVYKDDCCVLEIFTCCLPFVYFTRFSIYFLLLFQLILSCHKIDCASVWECVRFLLIAPFIIHSPLKCRGRDTYTYLSTNIHIISSEVEVEFGWHQRLKSRNCIFESGKLVDQVLPASWFITLFLNPTVRRLGLCEKRGASFM